MKNVIVANAQQGERAYASANLEVYVRAQIENSLQVGWAARDILLLTNFDYEFMGVKAHQILFEECCLTASKTLAVYEFFKNGLPDEPLWIHDLDAWQNTWFDSPRFGDVGICEYGQGSRFRFSGASVFYKASARDIVATMAFLLRTKGIREEAVLNVVLSTPAHERRVTVLDYTYNVGCACFEERCEKSNKPIRVCHFRPDCSAGMERHLLGQNELEVKTVNARLERLLRGYFDVPPVSHVEVEEAKDREERDSSQFAARQGDSRVR